MVGEKRVVNDSLVDKGPVRVLFIGCILIVAVMLIMSMFSIRIIENAVLSKLKTVDMGNLAQSYGAVIEGKIDRAVDASILLAHDPELIAWIHSGETDARAGEDVQVKLKDVVEQFGYETAFLVSNQTYHYWSYHDGRFELLNTVSKDTPSDAWFFSSIGMQKPYAINIDYNAGLKNTYVWINALVGKTDSPIAITGLGMNLSGTIQELIEKNRSKQTNNGIWLVDGRGVVQLATNEDDMTRNISELLTPALSGRISGLMGNTEFQIDEYTNAGGQLYDIAYRNIRDTDWKLVIQIPRVETTGFLSSVSLNIVFSGVAIISLVLFLFFLLSRQFANPYKRAVQLNRQLEDLVQLRTNELAEKSQKIQDGVDYAQAVQRTILPSDIALSEGLGEHFCLFEPKDTVSGDFYWFKRVQSGRLLVVGDCTGHGIAGALMTTAVSAMLNQITEQIADDPAGILKELDKLVKKFVHADGSKWAIPYGLDAAVFYVGDAGMVAYAGAALPVYVWDGATLQEAPGSAATIDSAARKKPPRFENQLFHAADNLTFYVATDGFWEQPGGEKNLPFGKTRLAKLLHQTALLPMERQMEFVRRALMDHQGAEPRRDDVTMLGFTLKIDGGPRDESFSL